MKQIKLQTNHASALQAASHDKVTETDTMPEAAPRKRTSEMEMRTMMSRRRETRQRLALKQNAMQADKASMECLTAWWGLHVL